MRLAEFISRNMEPILVRWEAFASTLHPAADNMSPRALRDHAQQILEAVVVDLSTFQTREEQADKSKGQAPKVEGAPDTAAEMHAVQRARSGLNINQLVAEYRALRASVLKLWMDACQPDGSDLDDIIRFDEAIDQAVTESIGFFVAEVEQARNLLLGMLSHDLRSPLNTIQMTALYLSTLNAGQEVTAAASRLISSGLSMKSLLDDLVDFNRTKLGLGINISPADTDLAPLFADELEQLRGAHPSCQIELEVLGDTRGHWDGPRLQQVLRNLVTNAIKYGATDRRVRVTLRGEEAEISVEVANRGPTIEQSVLEQMFEPLKRGLQEQHQHSADGSLGLGLYIVREVIHAHGGEVSARSGGGETVFTVQLPRHC